MRELEYRVWSDFWGKYADFDAELDMDGSVDADFEDDNGIPHHESTDLIVEFPTGLKDKNGKEIYEGDIIDFYGEKYEVVFRAGCFWAGYSNNQRDYLFFYSVESEVIGNIHENPELLERRNNGRH